jgi:beta-galactosidase
MRTALFFVAALLAETPAATAGARVPFDAGWRFALGDPPGAEAGSFDDSGWTSIDVPHDWSIRFAPDASTPSGNAGGYYPTGIGWYRRHFVFQPGWTARVVHLTFDGVHMDASVWVNGELLGRHPNGFTPFTYDLTAHLRPGQDNVVAVRVDNSHQPNCRWYSGSGIYRHVTLETFDPVHLDPAGIAVSTSSASPGEAFLLVEASVRNDSSASQAPQVEVVVEDPKGKRGPGQALTPPGDIAPGNSGIYRGTLVVNRPRLWSPDSPELYKISLRVLFGLRPLDAAVVTFGIRTLHVSADRGLELNGRAIKLDGGSVHHDNGALGAAAFDRAEERRVELLKAAGFNAVRTSHNPPSPAFLDACDRLGLLVIDEAFDTWAKGWFPQQNRVDFQDWWRRDLDAMVARDRNHPSVILWSIGNEVHERGSPEGPRIARMLADRIRELDRSRPITAGINGLGKTGPWEQVDPLFAELDVAGYNYELAEATADHARVPGRVIVGTESFPNSAFDSWAAVMASPYVVGDFVWSAMDYLGESGIGRVFPPGQPPVPHWQAPQFPWHGAECGDLDITGLRRPVSHYRAIVWDRGETLYMAAVAPPPGVGDWSLPKWSMPPALPSWTWPGSEGRTIRVDVFSRWPEVRLYLNGRLLGTKPTTPAEHFKATFNVPYEPGTLRAAAGNLWHGKTFELTTAGAAAQIRLTPDRKTIRADGSDLSFVTVEIVDRKGRLRPDFGERIQFGVAGPGEIAAAANADMTDLDSYQSFDHRAYQGRALVIVRAAPHPGQILLSASAPGLEPAMIEIQTRTAGPAGE